MPQVYDDPTGRQKPSRQPEPTAPPPAPVPPPPAPALIQRTPGQQERFADQVMLAAQRTNDIYRDLNPVATQYAPDSTFWAASVQNDPTMAGIVNDATLFFASIYGGENLAAFMSAELLGNPVQRERTIAALAEMRGFTYNPIAPSTYYRPTPAEAAQMAEGVASPVGTQELMLQVLDDPAKFDALSAADKARVAGIADELMASLQDLPDTGVGEQFKSAVAIAASGDFAASLTPEQVALLPKIAERLSGLKLGGTTAETPELASIGIEQVRQMAEGVFVLDLDWAKQKPDEAFAIKLLLEQEHPEWDIQFGRQGVVGSFLDKFGIAVDYITSPVGAGIQQLSELSERIGRSEEDKARLLAGADALEARIEAGEFEGDELDEAIRTVTRARESATDDVGWSSFTEQVVRNTRPRNIGFGFAESATRAADLLPGDPGYDFTYAVTGLAANIVADPLNWIIPGIGGLKAAKVIPRIPVDDIAKALGSVEDIAASIRRGKPALTTEQATRAAERILAESTTTGFYTPLVGRSWVKNAVYRALAKTPEELAVTKPFMLAQRRLWRLRELLGKDEFGVVLAQFFGVTPGQTGGDTLIAKHLADATSEDDLGLAVTRAMTGANYTPVNIDQLVSRLEEATTRLDSARLIDEVPGVKSVSKPTLREWDELIVERGWLEDQIMGRDWTRPMRSVLTPKMLRKLERLAGEPYRFHGRVIAAASDFVEKFPANVLNLPAKALARHAAQTPGAQRSAHEFMISLENMYKDTGAGDLLTFPHTSRYVGAGAKGAVLRTVGTGVMEDAVEQSFTSIVNTMRFMGLPNKRIRELMAPWVAGDLASSRRSYEWWKSTWQTMVDESTVLTAVGRQEMRTMWHSLLSDRSPGFIISPHVSGMAGYEPTLFRNVADALTEEVTAMGVPAFEADQFQVWRLPTLQDFRAHMTMLQRTMTDWRKLGPGGKRALSTAHLGVSQLWSATNQTWRTATLGFRLFGALPARIGMEQMLRIAAYDYASAVWHPAEWFMSTTLGTKVDKFSDVALFTDSPVNALGTMVRDLEANPNYYLARAGRETVVAADGTPFYRAYSERLGKIYASPSTHQWHLPHLGQTDSTLVAMREGKYAEAGKEWLALYDEIGMDPATAVKRTQQEITQMLGTGPGAEKIRAALQTGKIELDGEVIRIGTAEFADWLKGMAANGEWRPTPGMFLNRAAGDYLPVGRNFALAQFRDKLFNIFYTAPDLALSRSPLYRQVAAREFRNLIRRGYRPENAMRLAHTYAARQVADMMFTIGAKTSGEFFLKNINPFFPAYRELATTWLKRLPLRVGEGQWALGTAAIVRRGDVWIDFFKNLGVVQTDEQGKLFVPVPGLDKLVSLLTGANIDFKVTAPLDSFAGILPVPIGLFDKDDRGRPLPWYQRLKGVLPTLGAPSSAALGVINGLFRGALDDAENWLTMFGTDQSLGPMSVDRFFEAFGMTAPWMSGTTSDYHISVRTWAVVDGMRIARTEMGPEPSSESFDTDGDGDLSPEEKAAWAKATEKYAEELVRQGERYATGAYLLRAVAGMTLPFSIQISDEGKEKTSAMWALLNSLPDEGMNNPIISAFLAEYPQLGSYMTGKTQDLRTVDDPDETLDEFMDAVKSGAIEVRTPWDWAVFAMGMNSYSIFQSRLDAAYEEAGDTPAERLMNFDAKAIIAEERAKWETFLDLSDQRDLWPRDENGVIQQTKSLREMFDTYMQLKGIRAGEVPPLSLQQQRLLDFDRSQREFAKFFSPNPESSEEYYKLKEEAYAALAGMGDPGINWWYNTVSDPYYEKRNALYDRLGTIDQYDPKDRIERTKVYEAIRALNDKYNRPWVNADHPEWGEFPSPEEYTFAKLDDEDQAKQITNWASLPAYFLTEFQREKVDYAIPKGKQDEASELAEYVSKGEYILDKDVLDNDLSYSSTAVQEAKAAFARAYAKKAESLGLKKYWEQANAPMYERIGKALNLSEKTASWDWAAEKAAQFRKQIAAQGYVPSGTSDIAEKLHSRMAQAISQRRADDPTFDQVLTQLEVALGDDYNPLTNDDLARVLFFEVYQP